MARRRKKGALVSHPPLLSADDLATAVEDLASVMLGRSPLGKLVSKVAGRIVFRQVGGRAKRQSNKPKAERKRPRAIQYPGGVEYIPPPRKA